MPSLNQNGRIIEIGDLPEHGMSFQELETSYDQVGLLLKNDTDLLSVNLDKIASSNYSVVTFLIGCGELCSKKRVKIEFKGLSDEVLAANLAKLGFDKDGRYRPKEFRKEKPQSVFFTSGEACYKIFDDAKKLLGFIGEICNSFFYLFRHPRKLDLREVVYYMDKSGADAVPIVMLICFLIGVILGFQGITQMERFGLQIYIADLVGLALVRELGPLMVAMICIGRAGSAYAAELGTMNVAEEIDAMKTMGLKPARFLVVPKLIALAVVMPMLVVIGNLSGIVGGLLISMGMTDMNITEYVNRTIDSLIPANIAESMVKSLVFACIIAGVGCFRGFESEKDAKGVGKATTSSVVTGIFLVVIADFFVTFIFPQIAQIFGIKY
ncbi:MAG: ABC transporter permease [Victivallales bacterium]